jgi:hypothetical protein
MRPMRFRESWVGYAAALWAMIFAALHIIWATGWYIGLNQELSQKAFQQRWFLIYDLVVAGMLILAVSVALAFVRPWGMRLPRLLVGGLAWSGAALLVLRGAAGVAQAVYLLASGQNILVVYRLWEVWFCLGAFLFGLGAWRFWRMSRGMNRL